MEMQQLHYFKTVARLEHMSQAASKLHISQPSLSITIARLEEMIGVPLFDRNGKRIKLNDFGKVFLRQVELAFSALDEGIQEIRDVAGIDHGILTLAVTNLFVIPELLRSFLSKNPQVKFKFIQDTNPRMKQLLENREVNFCISSPPIQGNGIEVTNLYNERLYLIVPKSHRLANKHQINLQDVVNEPFISLNEGYGMRYELERLFHKTGFTPNISFEVNEPSLVATLIEAGVGIALVPEKAWIGSLKESSVRLHIENNLLERSVGLSWLSNQYMSTAAHHFRQFSIDFFSQY